jgi:hypothetical protein
LLLALLWCSSLAAQSPVYYWQRYQGDTSQSPALPDSTRALVPANSIVQADFQAVLEGGAEEITVYAVPVSDLESKPFILFSRNGRLLKRMEAPVQGGPAEFRAATFLTQPALKLVFFAYSTGADGSGNSFFALEKKRGRYSVIWHRHAVEGKMELTAKPAGFSFWESCCIIEDPPANNCVWCTHRYRVIDFQWKQNAFMVIHMHETREHLNPEPFVNKPITWVK